MFLGILFAYLMPMRKRSRERGQAAVEYALALCLVLVLLVWVPQNLLGALSTYFGEFTSLLTLPVP